MTDHSIAQTDEVLTELIELVETARTVPMSSNCMVPRERVLDLLDALREVLPTEIVEARRTVSDRDRLLSEASETSAVLIESTRRQADELMADCRRANDALIAAAQAESATILEAALAEQGHLVSETEIHRQATQTANELLADASGRAAQMVAEAEQYSSRLSLDAQAYAENTLTELVAHLQRLTATAENGRAAVTSESGHRPISI